MQSVTLRGADVKLLINGKPFPCQAITYTIDFGETEIRGIDSFFAQELVPTKISVKGTINGIKIKGTGGIQGFTLRSRISEVSYAPYIQLHLKDRHTDSDILIIQQCKVTSETLTVQTKTTAKLTCSFIGILPLSEMDINY